MDIADWYCCLHPRDRTIILNTCEGLILTLGVGIPLPIWDAFWLATGYSVSIYGGQFREVFGLEIVTIDVEDLPTEVVRATSGRVFDWGLWCIFILTPSAACLEGCGQSHFP